jgi:Protein of unknown function (DUF3667)
MKECKNCGTKSKGKFCYDCGQEVDIKRFDTKTILHEIVFKGIFKVENSKLKTFKRILLNPGNSVRDYIHGKRETYVKPFIYFLSLQTFFVVVFHKLSDNFYKYLNSTSTDSSSMEQIELVVKTYANYLYYLLPVFFSLYLYLFFRKEKGINYAESVVASMYWLGTSLTFNILFMLLSLTDIRLWNFGIMANSAFLIYAIMQFAEEKNLKGLLKGFLIMLLSYVSYVSFVIMVLQLYFMLTNKGVKIF